MSNYEFWDELSKIFNAVVAYQEKTIEFNKRFINPWIRLGNVFDKQDRNDEAVCAYQQAIEIDPDNAQNWYELGNIHFRMEKYDDAADSFNRAVELDPDFGLAYNNLALTLVTQGKYMEAIPLYRKSIDLLEEDKEKAVAWNRLGNLYRKLNEYDMAVDSFQKADECDQENAGFRDNLDEVPEAPTLVETNDGTDGPTVPVSISLSELIPADESLARDVTAELPDETEPTVDASNEISTQPVQVTGDNVEPATEPLPEVPADAVSVFSDLQPADAEVQPDQAPVQAVSEAPVSLEKIDEPVLEQTMMVAVEPAVDQAGPEVDVDTDAVTDAVTLAVTTTVEPVAEVVTEPVVEVPAQDNSDETVSVVVQSTIETFTDTVTVTDTSTETSAATLVSDATSPVIEEPVTTAVDALVENSPADEKDETTEPAPTGVSATTAVDTVPTGRFKKEATPVETTAPEIPVEVVEDAIAEIALDEEANDMAEAAEDQAASVAADKAEPPAVGQPAYEEFLKDNNDPIQKYQTAVGENAVESENLKASQEPIARINSAGEVQIEMDSKNAHVWNELGNVYFNTGAFDDAVIAYSKAIELDRWFAWPYSNLALTYVQKGRFVEAILLYQRSIELFSSDKDKAVSWNRLGNVYRRINDYENAISSYQRADELDPDNTTLSLQSRFSLLGSYVMEQKPSYIS